MKREKINKKVKNIFSSLEFSKAIFFYLNIILIALTLLILMISLPNSCKNRNQKQLITVLDDSLVVESLKPNLLDSIPNEISFKQLYHLKIIHPKSMVLNNTEEIKI